MQGRSTFDRAKDDLPYISLYLQNNVAVMRSNIEGYVQYPADSGCRCRR